MTDSMPSSTTQGALLSPRILETLDPCVVLMKELMGTYAHLWEDKGGIFSLAQGVVYWDPPASCGQALMQALSSPHNVLHTYGPARGIPELTTALEHKIAAENGLTTHDVMVTMGANQAYMNCVLTCLSGNSKAVVFAPYYFNHVMALQMACGPESVVIGPSSDDGIPDLDWLEQTLQRNEIGMVTVVNPGNPTGVSIPKSALQAMVELCERFHVWLIVDCTYEYFTAPVHQPIACFPDSVHTIHIFSLSKSYSLAGYRCGYLCLHKDAKDLLKQMLKVQDTIPICPPRISQVAALGALGAGKDWVYEKYQSLDESRVAIVDALQVCTSVMGGSGAMYVMGRLPLDPHGHEPDDVQVCRQLVEHHGIAIIPGDFCGFPGWIRVCDANLSPENCKVAAARLKSGLEAFVDRQG